MSPTLGPTPKRAPTAVLFVSGSGGTLEQDFEVQQHIQLILRTRTKKIKTSEDIFEKVKKDLIWLNVKYGQVVIFDQSLPHGNMINKENETRWSMNCRFKSIFTPYADKKIGEFFEPIIIRAATKAGFAYEDPL